MPWTANDADRHTHKATTSELKDLWAKMANESLERNGDEGRAVRERTLWWLDRHDPARPRQPTVSDDAVQFRAHLRTLRQQLFETVNVVQRGARAYVESLALLDQITQTDRPDLSLRRGRRRLGRDR